MELMALHQLWPNREGGRIETAWTQWSCAIKKQQKKEVSSGTLSEVADILEIGLAAKLCGADHVIGTFAFLFPACQILTGGMHQSFKWLQRKDK